MEHVNFNLNEDRTWLPKNKKKEDEMTMEATIRHTKLESPQKCVFCNQKTSFLLQPDSDERKKVFVVCCNECIEMMNFNETLIDEKGNTMEINVDGKVIWKRKVK